MGETPPPTCAFSSAEAISYDWEHSRNKHSKISMTPNHAAGEDLLFLARIKRGKKPQDVFPHFLRVSVIACRGEKLAVRYYSVTSEEVGVMWRKREQRKGHIYPAVAQPQPDNSEPLTPRQFHHPTFSSEFSLSCEEFKIRWILLGSAFIRYQPFWLQSSLRFFPELTKSCSTRFAPSWRFINQPQGKKPN